MGRLTSDPELRQTQSGIANCRFTVAIDRKYADKNTGEKQADFISCIAWKQTADFVAKYFGKGKMICVEGSLRTSTYQDKKHPDVNHYATDVFVENVEFCGDKGNTPQQAAQPQYSNHNAMNATAQQDYTTSALVYGNLSDFEEILSDGDVPF